MRRSPQLAQRLFNAPLAIHRRRADLVMAAIKERVAIGAPSLTEAAALWFDDDDDYGPYGGLDVDYPGYDLLGDIAMITVSGILFQRLGSMWSYGWATGYDGIRHGFLQALTNPAVKAIVLSIDSPGGEVAGCFDLVDAIYAGRGEKPIWAILSEHAYSAAYAIASAADRITVPRTGGTGSIGVIAMHFGIQGYLEKMGVDVTVITKGLRKADGHSEIPLSPEAREAIQAEVNTMGDLFDETVARNRSMSAGAVSALEAATYLGAAGIEKGLADVVMAPDAAFRALVQQIA